MSEDYTLGGVGYLHRKRGGFVYDVLLQLRLYYGIRIIMLIQEGYYFNITSCALRHDSPTYLDLIGETSSHMMTKLRLSIISRPTHRTPSLKAVVVMHYDIRIQLYGIRTSNIH